MDAVEDADCQRKYRKGRRPHVPRRRQSIGVGPNLLVVESRGRTVRLAREDIAQIFVLQSELVVRPRSAVSTAIERLLERDGFRFATSELSDYPLFVTALREHTGFQL